MLKKTTAYLAGFAIAYLVLSKKHHIRSPNTFVRRINKINLPQYCTDKEKLYVNDRMLLSFLLSRKKYSTEDELLKGLQNAIEEIDFFVRDARTLIKNDYMLGVVVDIASLNKEIEKDVFIYKQFRKSFIRNIRIDVLFMLEYLHDFQEKTGELYLSVLMDQLECISSAIEEMYNLKDVI